MRSLVLLLAVLAMAAAPLAAQTAPEKPAARPGRSSAKTLAVAPVNLNTATEAQLTGLPGIGPKAAQRILEYRKKNGSFKKIEEILETSRSCPYSLSVFDLGSLPSVSGSRQKSQQISR